jgi:predicted Zn-dependent protease
MYPTQQRLIRVILLVGLLLLQALAPAFSANAQSKAPEEDPEVKLGRENAAENDKTVKLITDPAVVERVQRIGQEIAAVANSLEVPAHWGFTRVKKFQYSFKVVDDKDVNAYSLPGGFIYVNKGLLDYVQSDDELAGVLAHEIAHAAHGHMMKLIREQNKMQQKMLLPLILLTVLSRSPGADIGNLIFAGQLYMVAKLNSYGVEAEKDADQTALRYLTRTKYNPVGLLTFMERLARDELRRPERELGIYRTHPPSPERAEALLAQLHSLNLPVNRRDTDPSLRATVKTVELGGVLLADVRMYDVLMARMAPAEGLTAQERGHLFADNLNKIFDQGIRMHEVRLSTDHTRILARSQVLVTFTQEDADIQKRTIADVAEQALKAVQNVIWREQFNRIPSTSNTTEGSAPVRR